jgi:hemoglobin
MARPLAAGALIVRDSLAPAPPDNTVYGAGKARASARASKALEGAMEPDKSSSLYDRLGGVYSIATVVDDLIDRVMSDARLNSNPAVDEAHHRVSPAGFKFLVTEMVCWAAGGPQQYSGRSMGDSHRHLGITEEEWAAFMDDLQQCLAAFAVPSQEQSELVSIVESTKEAIVSLPAIQPGTPSAS